MATGTIRLVQIKHPQQGRRVALVQEPELKLLQHTTSVYELALEAIHSGQPIRELIQLRLSPQESVEYDAVYEGKSTWRLLPAFDHPESPRHCMISGTGLTHKNSALNRQMMHQADNGLTDSMQMYQWGLAGGQPEAGRVGIQPEWFYKGTGAMLRAHNDSLEVPPFGLDGGEEPEVAGIYIIDREGRPWRIGFTTGNEFSDHVMEKKNYLYLAPSKLRTCAIGPELVLDADFENITGQVHISRNHITIWEKATKTGEINMAHSLANLEHHHFKYPDHRQPGQAHIHFFGADAFSFGDQLQLQTGDVMTITWHGFGRPLKNTISFTDGDDALILINALAL